MLGRISFLLDFEIPLEPDKFKFASLSGESVRTFAHLIKRAGIGAARFCAHNRAAVLSFVPFGMVDKDLV